MLIENFSQYPARRLEIQSALQFLSVHTWTLPPPPPKKKTYVALMSERSRVRLRAEVLTVRKDGPSAENFEDRTSRRG